MTAVTFDPKVHTVDFPALTEPWQRATIKALVAMRANPERGVVLTKTHAALDLSGCLAWRYGGVAYADAFRIVYAVGDGTIHVFAIGPRQGSAVYRTAQDRLRPRSPLRPMRHYLMEARPGHLHKIAGHVLGSSAAGVSAAHEGRTA